MIFRLIPALLSLCLLASLQGWGMHAHWHEHEHAAEPAHAHIVAALDADHQQAHAEGAVDIDEAKVGPRSAPQIPQVVAAAPSLLVPDLRPKRAGTPMPAEPRLTGPPLLVRPPGQAPPGSSISA